MDLVEALPIVLRSIRVEASLPQAEATPLARSQSGVQTIDAKMVSLRGTDRRMRALPKLLAYLTGLGADLAGLQEKLSGAALYLLITGGWRFTFSMPSFGILKQSATDLSPHRALEQKMNAVLLTINPLTVAHHETRG